MPSNRDASFRPHSSLLSILQRMSALGPSYQLHRAQKLKKSAILGMEGSLLKLWTRGLIPTTLDTLMEHLLCSRHLACIIRIPPVMEVHRHPPFIPEQTAAQKTLAQIPLADYDRTQMQVWDLWLQAHCVVLTLRG